MKSNRPQKASLRLTAKYRDLANTLPKAEIDDATTKQTLTMRQSDRTICSRQNQALYQLDDDVLTHFQRQGFFSRLASDEPFTPIERVRLENYTVETRARAADQRYSPPAGAVPGKALDPEICRKIAADSSAFSPRRSHQPCSAWPRPVRRRPWSCTRARSPRSATCS